MDQLNRDKQRRAEELLRAEEEKEKKAKATVDATPTSSEFEAKHAKLEKMQKAKDEGRSDEAMDLETELAMDQDNGMDMVMWWEVWQGLPLDKESGRVLATELKR